MKPKYIFTLLGSLALLTSCGEKFFEQYPSNSMTEGNLYQTDDDFNQAVCGCYARLKTNMDFHLEDLCYRSDECQIPSMTVSTQNRYDFDHFQENGANSTLVNIWNNWYNGIYRCNDVLDHMRGVDIENYDKYRGECLFLRSWWYFSLYRVFGGVPITRTVATPEESKRIRRCTDEEMFDLLYEDLSEAAELLPDTPGAEVARVANIAAYSLLGKVCLTFGEYDKAKAALEAAMENTNYGMESSTAAVFDVNNKMNKEMIFTLYYNKSNDNGHAYWYYASTSVMADIVNPTPEFKAIYDEADNRLELINTYVTISSNIYALTKWYDTYDSVYSTQVGNDFPHLRYADVVLMYAEAIAQGGGGIAEALTWLNMTRTRAGLSSLTTSEVPSLDDFMQELADERGREFALEGQRWFDLVRFGMAVKFFQGMGYIMDSHNLLFPIPTAQIEIVNDSSILWQNPGY